MVRDVTSLASCEEPGIASTELSALKIVSHFFPFQGYLGI